MAVDIDQEVDLVIRKLNIITKEGQPMSVDHIVNVIDALMRNADLATDPGPKELARVNALISCSEALEKTETMGVKAATDPEDVVKFEVPALIRCLEIAREDLKSDNQLHQFSDNLLAISKESSEAITSTQVAGIRLAELPSRDTPKPKPTSTEEQPKPVEENPKPKNELPGPKKEAGDGKQ